MRSFQQISGAFTAMRLASRQTSARQRKIFGSGVVAVDKIGWAIPSGSPCHNPLIALAIPTGAGEEIRTLDPNLGKVVLYH